MRRVLRFTLFFITYLSVCYLVLYTKENSFNILDWSYKTQKEFIILGGILSLLFSKLLTTITEL